MFGCKSQSFSRDYIFILCSEKLEPHLTKDKVPTLFGKLKALETNS
jgi:hypothetical protein